MGLLGKKVPLYSNLLQGAVIIKTAVVFTPIRYLFFATIFQFYYIVDWACKSILDLWSCCTNKNRIKQKIFKYCYFFLQKIPSNQQIQPPKNHRPAIICGIITSQIWSRWANLPKWWPQMPNWQDLNISWMKRTEKMRDFGLDLDTMPKDLKLWQSQLIIWPKR